MGTIKAGFERRIDVRNPYSGQIFFATKSRLIEGELKNFNRHGLFIQTDENLPLGEFITVALPYKDGKQSKVQGQVLWQNTQGYGIALVKKRSSTFAELLKFETKSK